jgi:hypothetical protein
VQLSNGSRQKIRAKSSNQNKAQQVKGKKIPHIAESVTRQLVERSSHGNLPSTETWLPEHFAKEQIPRHSRLLGFLSVASGTASGVLRRDAPVFVSSRFCMMYAR